MKILKLTAENVQRLQVVQIHPDGAPVVVVAGENEAGKSSVLDSIEMLLGGKDHISQEPIRRGAESARIVADFGDIIVTRRFTKNGTTLVVQNRDGSTKPSPQALLDSLVGKLSFDPLAFASMDPPKQEATLRLLAKIDTTAIDAKRKGAFEGRTLVNRDLAQAKSVLASLVVHTGVGTEPKSVEALTATLEAARELSTAANEAVTARAQAMARVEQAQQRSARATQAAQKAREALRLAEEEEETAQMDVAVCEDAYAAAIAAASEACAKVPDNQEIRTQMAEITAFNEKVEANRKHAAAAQLVNDKQAEADKLTAVINGCDVEKAELLANATFPLEGLGLADDVGVTWQGLPFAQASTAIRTRVSVAIGAALAPTMKVLLVRNGNDLDKKNLALLAETANELGLQIWLERIAGSETQTTVVLEDGMVASEMAGVR